ncbi:MAG TPA: hypothetical protein DCW29_23085 [Janthinobacterium sp.]|nr:hypothetical protein [Janthinobacterium sp.]
MGRLSGGAGAAVNGATAPAPAAMAVHMWSNGPGPALVPRDGVLVIGVATAAGAGRDLARRAIRLALPQAMAHCSGLAPERIALRCAPGRAPRLLLGGEGGAEAGLSISHEDGLSLAAVNLHGAVGVDLMRAQDLHDLPDWRQLAIDYLGMAVAKALADVAPGGRALAFARAWTAREAELKCRGLALSEWTPLAPACRRIGLALPAGLSGTLALPA